MVLINYITKFAFQTHCWKYDKKKESGFGEWGFAICYRCLSDRFIETLLYRFVFGVHCPSLLVRSICRTQHWSSHFTQKSISRSRSKSREIIAGQRLYAGGSNYNWLRESDNGRLLSSNFIRELSLPRIIYNGLISYNQV